MTQINLFINSFPRDLLEFSFFLFVGFTAGSIGLIWNIKNISNLSSEKFSNLNTFTIILLWKLNNQPSVMFFKMEL